MSDLGTVTARGDVYDLVFERRIAKPIDKVWAALITPERIADWFAIVDLDPRLGGHYRLKFSPDETPTEGVIVEFDPPRLLAHTWPDPGHDDAIVRYELTPDGDGCRLRFSNIGVPKPWVGSVAGWHLFLDALPGAIDGVRFVWSMEAEQAVLERYKDQLPQDGD
jgi:uncharacterized protein YndB with AHSA1/START domain